MPKTKSAAEKLAELQQQVKEAKEQMKADEQKRFAIIGSAVAELLKKDPDFKAAVLPKLQASLTSSRDKAAIEQFLV